MRLLLSFLLGFGAVSSGACKSRQHAADVKADTVTMSISGMT